MMWPGNRKKWLKGKLAAKRRRPRPNWKPLESETAKERPVVPIEEIRRQAIILSSRGLGQGTRSRSAKQGAPTAGAPRRTESGPLSRRGAA